MSTLLSGREQQILAALGQGRSNKEIARSCGISPSTAKAYIRSIMRKLGAHNRTQAALIANSSGNGHPPSLNEVLERFLLLRQMLIAALALIDAEIKRDSLSAPSRPPAADLPELLPTQRT